MSFLIIRSIPLSNDTQNSWRSVGGIFARRDRDQNSVAELAQQEGHEFILNLGNTIYSYRANSRVFVVNNGSAIRPLVRPSTTRKLYHEFLPPIPSTLPALVWLKAPGRAGNGKEKLLATKAQHLNVPRDWDIQTHISGQEYRVITVGVKVVQVFKRFGGNRERSYEWVGLGGSDSVLKDFARKMAGMLEGINLIGWDMIKSHDGELFLLEGNSAPGVNNNTAERVYREIIRQKEEHFTALETVTTTRCPVCNSLFCDGSCIDDMCECGDPGCPLNNEGEM